MVVWLERYRKLSLGLRILLFMGIGVLAGLVFGERAAIVQPVGDLFIRLLLMAAIPLVFFNLLAAIAGLTDVSLLGRLGIKILAYYTVTTAIALTLGLTITAWLQPGRGIQLTEAVSEDLGEIPGMSDVLLDLVPTNVVKAFAEGNVAQIVVFAVLLGIASLLLAQEQREPLQRLFQSLAELLRKLVALVLRFGPLGIGALAAATVGKYGSSGLRSTCAISRIGLAGAVIDGPHLHGTPGRGRADVTHRFSEENGPPLCHDCCNL